MLYYCSCSGRNRSLYFVGFYDTTESIWDSFKSKAIHTQLNAPIFSASKNEGPILTFNQQITIKVICPHLHIMIFYNCLFTMKFSAKVSLKLALIAKTFDNSCHFLMRGIVFLCLFWASKTTICTEFQKSFLIWRNKYF